MRSDRLRAVVACLLVLVMLGLAAVWALACGGGGGGGGGGKSSSDGPGPNHNCNGNRPGLSGPSCNGGGKPTESINTYTGNLTINDMPVFYQSVGDAIPFTIVFNSQSAQTGPVGPQWTHSYNIRLIDQGTSGATVIDGNGWEHWFELVGGQYDSQYGVFDKLQYEGAGWKLTRPDQHKLHFNSAGTLTSIEDKDCLVWTLAYSGGLLSTVTDPKGRQTSFAYTSGRLTRVTVPGGLYASFTYDGSGRLSTDTDAVGDTYAFSYSGTDTKVTSITDPSGRQIQYAYDIPYSKPVVSATSIYGLASSTVSYSYTTQSDGQIYVDATEYKGYPSTRTTRCTTASGSWRSSPTVAP